jgi:hypothetical protein
MRTGAILWWCLGATFACRGQVDEPRYRLATQVPGSAGLVVMVDVTSSGEVRPLPGVQAERPARFWLRGSQIVDGQGAEQLACRGTTLFQAGKPAARLDDRGFSYLTTKVVLGPGGDATVVREGDPPQHLRYSGLRDDDVCTAALLFFMVPAPSASG